MALYSIIGDVGSGKTLLATYLAQKDFVKRNRKILSNYKINLPTYVDLKPESLLELKDSSKDSALIVIDEAYTWLESRLSGRNINLFMSYILFQSRKRGLDIVITDQLIGTIDLRFRQMTNYEIQCQNINKGFEYILFKVNKYSNAKPVKFIMPYSIAEKIYPLYDSWQMISSIDDSLIYSISKDKTAQLEMIEAIKKDILDMYPANYVTKGIVEFWLMQNGFHQSMRDNVYNAIKSQSILDKVGKENEEVGKNEQRAIIDKEKKVFRIED